MDYDSFLKLLVSFKLSSDGEELNELENAYNNFMKTDLNKFLQFHLNSLVNVEVQKISIIFLYNFFKKKVKNYIIHFDQNLITEIFDFFSCFFMKSSISCYIRSFVGLILIRLYMIGLILSVNLNLSQVLLNFLRSDDVSILSNTLTCVNSCLISELIDYTQLTPVCDTVNDLLSRQITDIVLVRNCFKFVFSFSKYTNMSQYFQIYMDIFDNSDEDTRYCFFVDLFDYLRSYTNFFGDKLHYFFNFLIKYLLDTSNEKIIVILLLMIKNIVKIVKNLSSAEILSILEKMCIILVRFSDNGDITETIGTSIRSITKEYSMDVLLNIDIFNYSLSRINEGTTEGIYSGLTILLNLYDKHSRVDFFNEIMSITNLSSFYNPIIRNMFLLFLYRYIESVMDSSLYDIIVDKSQTSDLVDFLLNLKNKTEDIYINKLVNKILNRIFMSQPQFIEYSAKTLTKRIQIEFQIVELLPSVLVLAKTLFSSKLNCFASCASSFLDPLENIINDQMNKYTEKIFFKSLLVFVEILIAYYSDSIIDYLSHLYEIFFSIPFNEVQTAFFPEYNDIIDTYLEYGERIITENYQSILNQYISVIGRDYQTIEVCTYIGGGDLDYNLSIEYQLDDVEHIKNALIIIKSIICYSGNKNYFNYVHENFEILYSKNISISFAPLIIDISSQIILSFSNDVIVNETIEKYVSLISKSLGIICNNIEYICDVSVSISSVFEFITNYCTIAEDIVTQFVCRYLNVLLGSYTCILQKHTEKYSDSELDQMMVYYEVINKESINVLALIFHFFPKIMLNILTSPNAYSNHKVIIEKFPLHYDEVEGSLVPFPSKIVLWGNIIKAYPCFRDNIPSFSTLLSNSTNIGVSTNRSILVVVPLLIPIVQESTKELYKKIFIDNMLQIPSDTLFWEIILKSIVDFIHICQGEVDFSTIGNYIVRLSESIIENPNIKEKELIVRVIKHMLFTQYITLPNLPEIIENILVKYNINVNALL